MPLRNPVVQQSVATLRAWLQAKLHAGDKMNCPVCDRYTQMYNRKITSSMAFILIKLCRHFESNPTANWLHVANFLSSLPMLAEMRASVSHSDWTKLRFWNMIEEMPGTNGKPRAGYWRPTQVGYDFVDASIDVPHHAYVINNSVVGWSTERTDILYALGDKFDYRELIG